jgi:putative hydrolase of the HAD superfamily
MQMRAIIFDLGRVVLDFDHTIAAQKIARLTDKTPEEIYGLFFDSRLIQSFEEGKISPEDFFGEVKRMLSLPMGFAEFLPIWNGIFFQTDQNRQVYTLARGLRGRYRTALLSNVNRLHFEYVHAAFPVFDAFDVLLLSYKLGCVKPDPEIYRRALSIIGTAPQETFYVDDRPELIAQAQELGLCAFVYQGVERLKTDLASCGIR